MAKNFSKVASRFYKILNKNSKFFAKDIKFGQSGEIWRNDGSLEMGKIIDLLDPFTEESRNRRMRADVL